MLLLETSLAILLKPFHNELHTLFDSLAIILRYRRCYKGSSTGYILFYFENSVKICDN